MRDNMSKYTYKFKYKNTSLDSLLKKFFSTLLSKK